MRTTSYKSFYEGGWQSGESGATPLRPEALNHMDEGIAEAHEHLVPDKQTADNATFLRNDGTWQKVTPENIGALKPSDKAVIKAEVLANFGMPSLITFTREGNNIYLEVTEADGSVVTDTIPLNAAGRPMGVKHGNELCNFVWGEGFE